MKLLCFGLAVSTLLASASVDALAEVTFTCQELAIMQAGAGGAQKDRKSLNELLQECEWAKRLNAATENPSADPHVMQEYQGYKLDLHLKEMQAELDEIRECQKSGRC
jgi:hypothetical protein